MTTQPDTFRRGPWPAPVTGLVAVLLTAAAGAWVFTVTRMSAMESMGASGGTAGSPDATSAPGPGGPPGPGGLGSLGGFTTTWVVMMAAMMLPSLAPMVLAYVRTWDERRPGAPARTAGATALFVAGYLATWAAVGVFCYAAAATVHALDAGFLAWDTTGRVLASGVLLGSALYQLTAPKRACLRHCRDPRLLSRRWHPGRLGALRSGLEHGGFCVGATWALMAALFALGWMSLGWMAFITVLVALEKLLPWKTLPARGVAASLAVLGLAVALVPGYLPGLAIAG